MSQKLAIKFNRAKHMSAKTIWHFQDGREMNDYQKQTTKSVKVLVDDNLITIQH